MTPKGRLRLAHARSLGLSTHATLSPLSLSLSSPCWAREIRAVSLKTRAAMSERGFQEKLQARPQPFKLILGSSSFSRQKILADMGYQFTLMSADIDEKGIRREKPEELVMALAEAKADAIISKLQITDYKNDAEPTLLITADICHTGGYECGRTVGDPITGSIVFLVPRQNGVHVVVHEGVIREKPSSKEEARSFIQGYSGKFAATVGSVLVTNLKTGTRRGAWDRAEVYFRTIPNWAIEELIEEGIMLKVAGGLLVEHPLMSRFVESVVGTSDSVMGLHKELTEKLIQGAL